MNAINGKNIHSKGSRDFIQPELLQVSEGLVHISRRHASALPHVRRSLEPSTVGAYLLESKVVVPVDERLTGRVVPLHSEHAPEVVQLLLAADPHLPQARVHGAHLRDQREPVRERYGAPAGPVALRDEGEPLPPQPPLHVPERRVHERLVLAEPEAARAVHAAHAAEGEADQDVPVLAREGAAQGAADKDEVGLERWAPGERDDAPPLAVPVQNDAVPGGVDGLDGSAVDQSARGKKTLPVDGGIASNYKNNLLFDFLTHFKKIIIIK